MAFWIWILLVSLFSTARICLSAIPCHDRSTDGCQQANEVYTQYAKKDGLVCLKKEINLLQWEDSVHLFGQPISVLLMDWMAINTRIRSLKKNTAEDKGSKVCMKELDCFELTEDFYHPLYRPFNFLPFDRVTINTRFHLFTRAHPKEGHDLAAWDVEGISDSSINPKLSTKFIVHGYIDNRLYGKWMEVLKDSFLLQGEYNVIIVDWSGGNGPPYAQASANTRVVGAEIALLIKALQRTAGIDPMDCHIVGHSLGSHIAGYAGERLKNLGRISAVDPAEPFFQNMPPSVRIDPTDADFVDVIHTDSKSILLLGLGMSQLCGHVDFFPNDGQSQPGCMTDPIRSIFMEGLVDATRRFVACNHQRAVDFYTTSINYRKALPVAYQCPSWDNYLKGMCADCGKDGRKCAIMGIRADEYKPLKNDSKPIKMYLSTSGTSPYWVFHYQITVKLFKPKTGFKDQKGTIKVILNGMKSDYTAKVTEKAVDLFHGATYRFLATTSRDLGAIRSVTFLWESSSWNIFKSSTLHLEYVKVVSMNSIVKDETNTKTFCDKPEVAIKPKVSVSLTDTTCS